MATTKRASSGVIRICFEIVTLAVLIAGQIRGATPANDGLGSSTQPAAAPGASIAQSEITGKILTPEGVPIPMADVYLIPDDTEQLATWKTPAVQSDATGTFSFKQVASGGTWKVVVRAKGFGLSFTSVAAGKPVELKMSLPIELKVSFIDPDGKPAADVPLRVLTLVFQNARGFQYIRLPQSADEPFAGKTDSAGVLTLADLPQGARLTLSVSDEQFAQLSYQNSIQLAQTAKMVSPPIHLLSAGTIAGQVYNNDTGAPAAGVQIDAQSPQTPDGGFTTSDADGNYVLKQMRPGHYNIEIYLKGELEKSFTARAVENFAVNAGEKKTGADFPLIPGALIQGKLLSEDGKPIPGFNVGIYGPAHPRSSGAVQVAKTADDGTFTARVPGGDQYVYLELSEAPLGFALPAKKDMNLNVADGQTASIEFRLPTAPVRHGKVVDVNGKPVAGVIVSYEAPGLRFGSGAVSKADGTFDIPAPPGNGQIKLRARLDDLATRKAVTAQSNADDLITIVVEKDVLATIAGRVVAADGTPLANVDVQLIEMAVGMGIPVAKSDEQGKFSIPSLLADGNYLVSVTPAGYGPAQKQCTLKPGQTFSTGDLIVQKKNSRLAGVLVDAAGKPVAGQMVQSNGRKSGTEMATTDGDGKFQIEVLGGDTFDIYVRSDSGQMISVRAIKSGDENIHLQLPAESAPPAQVP